MDNNLTDINQENKEIKKLKHREASNKSQFKRAEVRKEAAEVTEKYLRLTDREKIIIRQMVMHLRKNKNVSKDIYFGQRLNAVLETYNKELSEEEKVEMTLSKLATIIHGYLQVSIREVDKTQGTLRNKYDYETIKSKLNKLATVQTTKEEDDILKLACGYLCISTDVITKGSGERYFIDIEKTGEIIGIKNIDDVEDFLQGHKEFDFDFELENSDNNEFIKYKKNYEKYIHHNAQLFAEIVSDMYNVDINSILQKETYTVEIDTFEMDYQKLSDTNRKFIKDILEKVDTMPRPVVTIYNS